MSINSIREGLPAIWKTSDVLVSNFTCVITSFPYNNTMSVNSCLTKRTIFVNTTKHTQSCPKTSTSAFIVWQAMMFTAVTYLENLRYIWYKSVDLILAFSFHNTRSISLPMPIEINIWILCLKSRPSKIFCAA